MITFGPVPSRRLGRSLGINNIPYKICTYSCVYCQIGRTLKMQLNRAEFYKPSEIYDAVSRHLEKLTQKGEKVDYMTFVPDGEPTLDKNLGEEIKMLKTHNIPIAVITNGSLIYDSEVRDALNEADFISLKVDAVSEKIWRSIDRPHRKLDLEAILDGMRQFADRFHGKLVTETMLIDLSNSPIHAQDNRSEQELEKIADFIAELSPDVAYIAVPTRPPAEEWVAPASEDDIAKAYHIFSSKGLKTEYLIGFEGYEFASTGDIEKDILSITAVHPMREDALAEFLKKNGVEWRIVEQLIEKGMLKAVDYMGHRYYLRVLKRQEGENN